MDATTQELPVGPGRSLDRWLHDTRVLMTGVLMLSSAFALSLLAARMVRAGAWDYRFLVWNLFLAWMPFLLALAVDALARGRPDMPRPARGLGAPGFGARFVSARGLALLLAGAAWLVFFPNAPYLITDYVHLRPRQNVPLWFDILLLTSFAWNGLLLGFASLRLCHRVAERRLGSRAGWTLVVATLFLAGFGIYLGRFPRWNSWDVLTSPLTLLGDVASRFVDPMSHPRTWVVTLGIGGFLLLGYVTILTLAHVSQREERPGR